MAEREACGVWQSELPRQRFRRHQAAGSMRGASPATAAAGGEVAMAAAWPEGRDTAATMQGQKTKLSQRAQELRAVIALQEQGRKFFTQSCEEKLGRNRELLPRLREAVQEDAETLDIARKHKHIMASEVLGAQNLSANLARQTMEVAREKLRATVYNQVNTCNMLLHQVRQRCQVWDELQQQLQRLQEMELDEKKQQVQVIRQLENNIDKMLTKVRAGENVTTLYLGVRDVLRKELSHLPSHLDLLGRMSELYHMELKDMEVMASDARKAADIAQEDMAKRETQFLADRQLRYRSLASQKVHIDRLWLRELSEKNLRAQAKHEFTVDLSTQQDPLVATELEAAKSQRDHAAWITEKMEAAKAAVQCSRLWDIPSKLLAQQKSLVDLENYIKESKEKKQVLKKVLRDLELQQAELKFHQPPNKTRMLEEELRVNLQSEEARLEQTRAQMLRNQMFLLEFENSIDNLIFRLHGITMPDQDDSLVSRGVEEKLQHCEQKLQYLAQRVADLPPDSHIPDESNETFVKVRNFLEKTTANDVQNLKISLEDRGSSVHDPFDFVDKHDGQVLTREDIKKQGLQLIESMKKASKKK